MTELFDKDCIYVSDAKNKEDLFYYIYQKLLEKSFVKENFYEMILEREKNYPTGMDMSVVNPNLSNIAIPHTEPSTVNVTKIIPIKLKNSLKFNNMIEPDKEILVDFAFMILNKSGGEQTNILSQIMDFVTKTEDIGKMFESNDVDYIYNFIKEKF
ncbi:PTS sugar transporter subunit IIA [Anaerococcus sp. AGMB00486]|uniref:PTS sugar transporter subunit IIA n=2 Tax=Anaerococcus TaxID=165779 RepID=A0ABX2N924_9FIRM|nr:MULTISPECIES: PTS sugar transporter subunit IIA [Anaerococcus]MDY3005583.1 PTS sugar transporter subunit IIA [Anaerococcus porci]MSS77502.1 PTS sugar transporter subunit IIA [Anaerococcus porci]NVF11169.1 PTS sugar transporter subunit IIA [Anaerococcus faecalis]